MRANLIDDDAQKTFALVFDKNDEVMDGLGGDDHDSKTKIRAI